MTNHETVRRHLQATAQRMEQALGEERPSVRPEPVQEGSDREQPLPDGPITGGVDGGYVRAALKQGFFEVIARISVATFRRSAEDTCRSQSASVTCPAAFGGVRFMPEGIASLLVTYVTPPIVTTALLFVPGGSFLTRLVDEMPLAWLTWPQVFRSIGGLFLVNWAYVRLPG